MLGHFQSRDKDGGHIVRSAIGVNSMLHTNFVALHFIERGLFANRRFPSREKGLYIIFAPVTLTLTR